MALRASIHELAADPEVAVQLRLLRQELPPASHDKPLAEQVAELREKVQLLEEMKKLRVRLSKTKARKPKPRPSVDTAMYQRPDYRQAQAIARKVAGEFYLSFETLRSRNRTASVCAARFEFFRRAHAAKIGLGIIGLVVERDDGTVLHGLRHHPEAKPTS